MKSSNDLPLYILPRESWALTSAAARARQCCSSEQPPFCARAITSSWPPDFAKSGRYRVAFSEKLFPITSSRTGCAPTWITNVASANVTQISRKDLTNLFMMEKLESKTHFTNQTPYFTDASNLSAPVLIIGNRTNQAEAKQRIANSAAGTLISGATSRSSKQSVVTGSCRRIT